MPRKPFSFHLLDLKNGIVSLGHYAGFSAPCRKAAPFVFFKKLVLLFGKSYLTFGFFAPYLERDCLRSFTPCKSSEPRTMW